MVLLNKWYGCILIQLAKKLSWLMYAQFSAAKAFACTAKRAPSSWPLAFTTWGSDPTVNCGGEFLLTRRRQPKKAGLHRYLAMIDPIPVQSSLIGLGHWGDTEDEMS
jgi:hypothetical protein